MNKAVKHEACADSVNAPQGAQASDPPTAFTAPVRQPRPICASLARKDAQTSSAPASWSPGRGQPSPYSISCASRVQGERSIYISCLPRSPGSWLCVHQIVKRLNEVRAPCATNAEKDGVKTCEAQPWPKGRAMTIDEFLRETGMTSASLARNLRCSKGAVSLWRSGRRHPNPRLMAELVRLAGGKVSARDFPDQRRAGRPAGRASERDR